MDIRCLSALVGVSLGITCVSASAAVGATEIVGTHEAFASKAVYFVVTDRFVDGDPSNNQEDQGGDYPTFNRPIIKNGQAMANLGYMGGDFKGIVNNADYIAEMGFGAVWGTPVVDNPDQAFSGGFALGEGWFTDKGKTGYHGYWGVNFYEVDEHLPSRGLDFAQFTQALDQAGLDFVLDIVGNHGSPSFDMPKDQPKFGEVYDQNGTLLADHKNTYPEELDTSDPLHAFFHPTQDIAQLSNFNENNPKVVDYLIGSYLHWLDAGADAIRIDTIKHVPNHFWKTVTDRLRAKYPDLFFFAEHWDHDAKTIAQHTFPENGGISVLDFPGQKAMQAVFGQEQKPMSDLLSYLHLDDGVYANPYDLMTFYDNHDMPRMNATDHGFIDAHNWLFTSRGIPVVYYGSETGFRRGRAEHAGNRDYYGQDRVDAGIEHPIRQALIKIAAARKASVALQRGVQRNGAFDQNTAAFVREYQDVRFNETALVLLNKGDTSETISISVPHSGRYENLLTGEVRELVKGDWSSEVSAHGAQVWNRFQSFD
jgi:cyclomaltodextrin glucanotransferase